MLKPGLPLFRTALCLLLLFDLARWTVDFALFFTPDAGPLPLAAVVGDRTAGSSAWSLYFASCYHLYPHFLLGLTFLATLGLAAGIRPGPCSWMTFLLVLSLQNRAAIALDVGDAWMLAYLLALAFTSWPLGQPTPLLLVQLCLYQATAHQLMAREVGWGWWLALAVSPVLLIGTASSSRKTRSLVLGLLAIPFVLDLGSADLTPWLGLAGLLLWTGDLPFRPSSRSLVAIAVALNVALFGAFWLPKPTLLSSADREAWSAFWGLGPRAQPGQSSTWHALVGIGPEDSWDLLKPDQKPDYLPPSQPWCGQSYRSQLYLGALEQPENATLRYWIAVDFYSREQRRLGPHRVKRVEVYQCTFEGGQVVTKTLVARWPLQD